MAVYCHPRWPTRGHVIQMRAFYALLEASASVAAVEELQAYYAAHLAGARVWGTKEHQGDLDAAVATLAALAYPELPDEH